MKMIHRMATAVLAVGVCLDSGAAELTGTVRQDHVNVRGRASLAGEVITQVNSGETVTILEEIPVEKPEPGHPTAWLKIKMPANTPVWVHGSFVDAQNQTVSAARLNLRAGPGENFSVLGRLMRGDTLKPIRTSGDWIEIEPPATAFAFVAADLIQREERKSSPPPALPPATTESEKMEAARPSPAASDVVSIPQIPLQSTQSVPAPAILPAEEKPVADIPTPEPVPPVLTIEPATPQTPALPIIPPPVSSPAANMTDAGPTLSGLPAPPRRVVTREGIVRRALSIQAPAYYELVSPYSGKVINYLHLQDHLLHQLGTNLKQFKEYLGRRIIVTGQEGIDPRWPTIPLIEVETLKLEL